MAFSDLGNLGAGGSSGNNQTTLTVATATAVNAGDFVAVAVTVDNRTTGGGDTGDVTGVTIGGIALILSRQNATNLAAQAGASVSLWYGQPGALSSGVNMIATFQNAATSDASALSSRRFSVGAGNTVSEDGDNATTSTTATPGSLDVTTANAERLRIRAIGCEWDSTQTITGTGSWTTWTEGASAASGTLTEQVIEAEHRIVTATTSASNPSLGSACDNASVYAAFVEIFADTLMGQAML
jgi:hypothetical protein